MNFLRRHWFALAVVVAVLVVCFLVNRRRSEFVTDTGARLTWLQGLKALFGMRGGFRRIINAPPSNAT